MDVLKSHIVQDGIRNEEQRSQREEDRKLQSERQEDEAKRHEIFMEMMMMFVCNGVVKRETLKMIYILDMLYYEQVCFRNKQWYKHKIDLINRDEYS